MKTGIEYQESTTKRRLDIAGGGLLAISMMPLLAGVGAVSMADTKEPHPFFVQERVGRRGQPFNALKIRTLARAALDAPLVTAGTFDPRASKIGLFLRQLGLDELPQVANVLRGSMSLVGFRPMVEKDIDLMQQAAPTLFDEWFAFYQASRPGLAGPSQAFRHHFRQGTDVTLYRQSIELDLRYAEKASFKTDLKILAQTPMAMLQANIHVVDNLPEASQSGIEEAPLILSSIASNTRQ